MFLVDYLLTEDGFGGYGMEPDQSNTEEEQVPDIEHQDIKKYILYQQLKQIHQKLSTMQYDNADDEFYSLLNFAKTVIEFFNSLEYPEVIHLMDNLVDGVEEKLGLKLPARVPHEPPADEFPEEEVQPQQEVQPAQPAQPAQSEQQQQQPQQKQPAPNQGNNTGQ